MAAEQEEDLVFCTFCGETPAVKEHGTSHIVVWVSSWYRDGMPAARNVVGEAPQVADSGTVSVDGRQIVVPRVRRS